MIAAIVAVDKEYGIGKDGDLLVNIPEDKKFFKETTNCSTVMMGRKTWDSLLIKPLPNRKNIVISNNKVCYTITLEEAVDILKRKNNEKIFVIGGGQIYRELLPYCDTIYMTKIHKEFDADVFFQNIENSTEWVTDSISEMKFYKNIPYQFIVLKRIGG